MFVTRNAAGKRRSNAAINVVKRAKCAKTAFASKDRFQIVTKIKKNAATCAANPMKSVPTANVSPIRARKTKAISGVFRIKFAVNPANAAKTAHASMRALPMKWHAVRTNAVKPPTTKFATKGVASKSTRCVNAKTGCRTMSDKFPNIHARAKTAKIAAMTAKNVVTDYAVFTDTHVKTTLAYGQAAMTPNALKNARDRTTTHAAAAVSNMSTVKVTKNVVVIPEKFKQPTAEIKKEVEYDEF